MEEANPVKSEILEKLMLDLFTMNGLNEKDARTCSDVLILADLRGIDSHGVSRLPYYIRKLKNGTVDPAPKVTVINENPACALMDGGNGMGPVVGRKGMELAIRKAGECGAGFVSVRRSNHYGIAAYYSMMALEHDMIGISTTNAICMVAPTFSRKAMLGTNPVSVAFPCGEERPWVLDMATSTAPFGKLELAMRSGENVPTGWVQDPEGKPWDDPKAPLVGGALTPLGATREMGGHKGYGLAALVDILSAVLSGANYGPKQEGLTSMRPEASDVGHFFGAIRLDGFRPPAEFKSTMDEMVRGLKNADKAKGMDRIFVHGEIEFEIEKERRENGIPLHPMVRNSLAVLAKEHGIEVDLG